MRLINWLVVALWNFFSCLHFFKNLEKNPFLRKKIKKFVAESFLTKKFFFYFIEKKNKRNRFVFVFVFCAFWLYCVKCCKLLMKINRINIFSSISTILCIRWICFRGVWFFCDLNKNYVNFYQLYFLNSWKVFQTNVKETKGKFYAVHTYSMGNPTSYQNHLISSSFSYDWPRWF